MLQFTFEAIILTRGRRRHRSVTFSGAMVVWIIPAVWPSLPAHMSMFWTSFGFSAAAGSRAGLRYLSGRWKAANLDPVLRRCGTSRIARADS